MKNRIKSIWYFYVKATQSNKVDLKNQEKKLCVKIGFKIVNQICFSLLNFCLHLYADKQTI